MLVLSLRKSRGRGLVKVCKVAQLRRIIKQTDDLHKSGSIDDRLSCMDWGNGGKEKRRAIQFLDVRMPIVCTRNPAELTSAD